MSRARFLVVCLNPVIQHSLVFDRLVLGQVNRTATHRVDASGKGINVARVLRQLGREAVQLSQLGGPTRDYFLSMCADDGLIVRWVDSNSEIRTCTTVIDAASGSATELVEEALPVGEGTAERLASAYAEELERCDMVIVSGTKAAGFPASIMADIARLAQERGKRLILDIKGADLESCLPFRPLVAKPNLEELLQTYYPAAAEAYRRGASGGLDDDTLCDFVAQRAKEYWQNFGTMLVVTRGARPSLFWDGASLRERQGEVVRAINPIGSGDSFTAGLAAVLADGGDIEQAVAEGQRAGALNALRLKPGSIA
jgi:Fructose-1-phosphate kinase and related fructose-6-phosphate kinase (PfkB)